MQVTYCGWRLPHWFCRDISFTLPADLPVPSDDWFAISVNDLHGYKYNVNKLDIYSWLRSQEPYAMVGYSILIYRRAGGFLDTPVMRASSGP
jgi:hypothetical protein